MVLERSSRAAKKIDGITHLFILCSLALGGSSIEGVREAIVALGVFRDA